MTGSAKAGPSDAVSMGGSSRLSQLVKLSKNPPLPRSLAAAGSASGAKAAVDSDAGGVGSDAGSVGSDAEGVGSDAGGGGSAGAVSTAAAGALG